MPRLGTVPRRHALGGGNVGGTRGMPSLKERGGELEACLQREGNVRL